MEWVVKFLGFEPYSDISEEKLEEYKMLSGFKESEILRLRKVFLQHTGKEELMSREVFQSIEVLALNPLLDRVCLCFGLEGERDHLDFQEFLVGIAAFNSPGLRQQKLKLAFKIQDFDNDGVLSKADLGQYIQRITASTLTEEEISSIVAEVIAESSSDPKAETLSFTDFQRVVAPLDFQAKIRIPI